MSYVLSSLSRDKFQTDEQGIASIFCSCNDSEEGVVGLSGTAAASKQRLAVKASYPNVSAGLRTS